ncbi:MAG: glutamate--tRNA ligase [Patescibacteria group bacterium]
MSASQKIKTRFAPSPTGRLHIGGLRTALYSYALAKHSNGGFVLRIEDTDKKREVKGAKQEIEKLLKDFGLNWDEHYVQSERAKKGIYKKAAELLVKEGKAFYCQCKPKNAKKSGFSKELRDPCRGKNLTSGAIKLKVPDNEKITFVDYVHDKEISWDTSVVADATLLKSDGMPTYHLAVVVDDHDMGITHALRGHDWLPSTPVHLLVYKYLGYQPPEIGHLTDILDPEGGKLSKRKGSVTVQGMLEEGYLKEAILNFIMLLGWAPKDDREIFSLDQFVKVFDRKGFQRANPFFNRDKLDWMNGEYLRKLSDKELAEEISEFVGKKYPKDKIFKIVPLIKERIKTLSEFISLAGFFFEEVKVKTDLLGDNYKKHLKAAIQSLEKIDGWEKLNLDKILLETVKENDFKTGDFFMDLRIAITGKQITPPINDSITILGKEKTLKRLKRLIK